MSDGMSLEDCERKAADPAGCARYATVLIRVAAVTVLLVLFAAPPSAAQEQADTAETRTELLREMRQEKAQYLTKPEATSPPERFLGRIEDRLTGGGQGTNLYGFRPTLGGLKPGAGISGGIVFEPFGDDESPILRVDALASLERYWGIGVHGGYRVGRATILGYGRYRHMPREDFFGFGSESELNDQSNYLLNEAVAGLLVGFRANRLGFTGIRSSYVVSDPGPGKDDQFPSTLNWAAPLDIPSLMQTGRHLALGGWVELDARDPKPGRRAFKYLTHTEPDVMGMPLATDRGAYLLADVVHYMAVNDAPFDFTRITLQSQQYVPFRNGRNVFAFREYLALSHTDDSTVPLYMLPALGGAYTLRGFELYRFRDRHALLLNAEYRWQVWLFADLALFADAGQVFSDFDEISLDELHTSYGAGVRLRTYSAGLARVDLARSIEGTQLHIRLSAYF